MEEFEADYKEILEALDIIKKRYGDYTYIFQIIDQERKQSTEHRLKMELFLGRKLKRGEYVHHKNLNKEDNRIENLWIVNRSEHMTAHQSLRSIGEAIALILYERRVVYFDERKGIYKVRYKEKVFDDIKKGRKLGEKKTQSDS